MNREIVVNGIYRHFKHDENGGSYNNHMYVVLGVSKAVEYGELLSMINKETFNNVFIYAKDTENNNIVCIFEHEGQLYHKNDKDKNLVIYKSLYDNHIAYARPVDMFLGEVDEERYPNAIQRYRFEQV